MKKSILYQIFILLGILIAGCDEMGMTGITITRIVFIFQNIDAL